MPTFLIERDIPGAGKLTTADFANIARTSCSVVPKVGSPYKWRESYVVADKIFCVHEAESEAAVRRHSELGGFPITKVTEIKAVIGPKNAE